jgi:transglutaminase-like putative cysteine protease
VQASAGAHGQAGSRGAGIQGAGSLDVGAWRVDGPPTDADLAPTPAIDADHPAVVDLAREVTAGAGDPTARAVRLFAVVRDLIRYDPYVVDLRPEAMRASAVLAAGRSWCVPKATLLAATARAVGVPARLGFADVRNHLATPRLLELLGSDLFLWHGYAALWLDGAWRKATPAFNAELCARFGVAPLTFDGRDDALLHPFDGDGARYMEYLHDRGTADDLPLDVLRAELEAAYPPGLFRAADTLDPVFRARSAADGGDA